MSKDDVAKSVVFTDQPFLRLENHNSVLLALLESLSLEFNINTMAEKALQAATSMTGGQVGAVALLEDDGRHLRYRWYIGLEQSMPFEAMQKPFNVRHGLGGLVMQSRKTVVVGDYPGYKEALQSYVAAGVKSGMSTPIFDHENNVMGILSIGSLHKHINFEPEHERLAEMIARQFGIALHRERLFTTQQKNARALKALSACNEVMMHSRSEGVLLQEVCNVIVQEEGYLGAWFAYKDDNAYKSIVPRAVAGIKIESLMQIEYSWNENDEKLGTMPPGEAIRTGQHVIVNDVHHDKDCECCRLLANEVGYQSVLALPIKINDEVAGVLTIYGEGVNAFAEEEVLLLSDMAKDLSFGLQTLFTRIARHNAVIKLRESEQKFKTIFDNAKDGVLVADAQTRHFFTGNNAICDMLGYSWEELTNLRVDDIHPPEALDRANATFASAVEQGQCQIDDMPMQRRDGSICYVDISAARVELDGHKYLIGNFRDITERKKAQEELLKSNTQLAEAQSIAHLGNWNWNIKDNILNWSDEIYRIFGLEPQSFGATYEAFIALVHPEDAEYMEDEILAAINEKKSYSVDHRICLPDGSIEYVHEQGEVHYDEQGEPLSLIGTVQNITERVKAEKILCRTNRALKTLSRCNEIIAKARDEQQLLREICDAIAVQGEFKLVWIGYAEMDEESAIRVAARAGQAIGVIENLAIHWRGERADQGPTGTAIRSNKTQLERDITSSEKDEDWRNIIIESGLCSFIALPLYIGDEVIGALNIYSDKNDAFDEEEESLLKELARDIAFGIASQRVRAERERVVSSLGRSERNLYNIINHEADGVMVLDDQGIIVFANPAFGKLIGRSPDELVNKPFGYPLSNEPVSEIELIDERGEIIQCEMRVTETDWQNEPCRIVSIHDISQYIKLEQERQANIERQMEILVETIMAMSNAVESRDPYTAGHMNRVSELSVAIAEQLGLDKDRIEGIRLGGLIHDLGKLYVPAEILNRPGRLTVPEFEIIKSHVQVGYDIIKGISFRWPVAEMVHQHHERIDGSGYPNGLKGEEIAFEARIMAVADVVEAMSSHRPYRPSLGIGPALDEITKNRGVIYEPGVVDACVEVIETGKYDVA